MSKKRGILKRIHYEPKNPEHMKLLLVRNNGELLYQWNISKDFKDIGKARIHKQIGMEIAGQVLRTKEKKQNNDGISFKIRGN